MYDKVGSVWNVDYIDKCQSVAVWVGRHSKLPGTIS